MTPFSDAEQARLRAVDALRRAGLTAEADRLAACAPIIDRATAISAFYAADDAMTSAYGDADRR